MFMWVVRQTQPTMLSLKPLPFTDSRFDLTSTSIYLCLCNQRYFNTFTVFFRQVLHTEPCLYFTDLCSLKKNASFQVKINKYASLEKKFLSCLDIYAFPEQLACFCPVEIELCNWLGFPSWVGYQKWENQVHEFPVTSTRLFIMGIFVLTSFLGYTYPCFVLFFLTYFNTCFLVITY